MSFDFMDHLETSTDIIGICQFEPLAELEAPRSGRREFLRKASRGGCGTPQGASRCSS